MTGRTGYTAPTNASAANFAVDIANTYAWFDSKVGEEISTASSLPASGNWNNRTIMANDTKVVYYWTGAAWRPTDWRPHAEFQWDRSAIADGSITLFTATADAARTNDAVATISGSSTQVITLRDAGIYSVSWHFALGAAATANSNVDMTTTADGLVMRHYLSAGQTAGTANQDNLVATTAGVVLTFAMAKTTGGSSNVTGKIRITKIGSY